MNNELKPSATTEQRDPQIQAQQKVTEPQVLAKNAKAAMDHLFGKPRAMDSASLESSAGEKTEEQIKSEPAYLRRTG